MNIENLVDKIIAKYTTKQNEVKQRKQLKKERFRYALKEAVFSDNDAVIPTFLISVVFGIPGFAAYMSSITNYFSILLLICAGISFTICVVTFIYNFVHEYKKWNLNL